MAEKTFTSLRLKNKYDTYANWTTNDPILLAGEIALVDVSSVIDGEVEHVPSILMKVGNGTKKFSELDWVYAKASNVHAWAMAADKPEYTADEIDGIGTYIDNYVNTQMGISVDTDTQYTLTKVTDYQYKLMSKGKSDVNFATEVAVIDIPNDTAAITALQGLVGNTAVADQIAAINTALGGRITAIEGDYLKTADKTALTDADAAMDERIEAIEDVIGGLAGAMHFKGVEATLPADVTGYVAGDVILVGAKEYVFNNGAFVEFGDPDATGQAVTDLTDRMDDVEAALDDKANEADLADVAFSGLWEDLAIGADTTIVIDCGTSAV